MRYAIVNIETDEAEFIGVTNGDFKSAPTMSVLEAWEQYAVLFCNAESFPAWLNSKDGDRFTELAISIEGEPGFEKRWEEADIEKMIERMLS